VWETARKGSLLAFFGVSRDAHFFHPSFYEALIGLLSTCALEVIDFPGESHRFNHVIPCQVLFDTRGDYYFELPPGNNGYKRESHGVETDRSGNYSKGWKGSY
jgi:hypothetical protein